MPDPGAKSSLADKQRATHEPDGGEGPRVTSKWKLTERLSLSLHFFFLFLFVFKRGVLVVFAVALREGSHCATLAVLVD